MKRRHFLKLSGSAVLAAGIGCGESPPVTDFPVEVIDDLLRGHRMYEGPPPGDGDGEERRDVLVVGAGIAGLTAAHALRDRDLVVCEIGAVAGGSASAHSFEGLRFSQGAHYDLPYPANYGADVLALLASLEIIHFNGAANRWDFTDTRYLIAHDAESRTRGRGGYREDPLPRGEATHRFERMLRTYAGKLVMPTRNIDKAFHLLEAVRFRTFLSDNGFAADSTLITGLDYQMRDDYGAGTDAVSALAGLHYYQCRPYYTEQLPHFSPPQGNAYFADKLLATLPEGVVRTGHLVSRIQAEGTGFRVEAIDLEANLRKRFRVDAVVYAGHKHGLKHVFPADAAIFAHNRYAPWVAVNLILDRPTESGYWQNEVLGYDSDFVGMVNSRAQADSDARTVLTLYFCFPEQSRALLLSMDKEPGDLIRRALVTANRALGQRIDRFVTRAFVKLHGHAMPIPVPGYLFRDGNDRRSHQRLVHAGVDNGYLPLLFEALDSGLRASFLLTRP